MHKCAQLDFSTILRLLLSRQRVCMNFTPCLLKIQITILFCSEFFTQSKTRNTKYMRFSWGNCIILLLCSRTCQKYTKSFKTEKYRRNSPIMQYYSYHLITSCSQNLIFNISVIARAFMPAAIPCMEQVLHCHCEGIYARGNPLHGASTATTPSSCLRLLRRYAPRNDTVNAPRHCERTFSFPSLRAHFLFSVIARAFMPVAIPCMEQVQQLHRPRV